MPPAASSSSDKGIADGLMPFTGARSHIGFRSWAAGQRVFSNATGFLSGNTVNDCEAGPEGPESIEIVLFQRETTCSVH